MDRITFRSGSPSPEEVAAVTAALAGIAAAAAPPPVRRTPAWGRAARVEATGQAPFSSAVDPRLTR
ncbi:hypothetical protein BH23ACT9_BH23ACT9_28620 [soil metagenome]